MVDYSPNARKKINASGADEVPLWCLEITHPGLAVPARIVNDNQDIVIQGDTFTAMPFRPVHPDDMGEGLPRAQIAIDNVGRELTEWIESSGGGKDAEVRMMQVLRSDPDVLEFDMTLGLTDVAMTMLEVTGVLGFDDVFNRPAVTLVYRPEVAPGLF